MSRYSNFIGYVPDKLRLITSGGGLAVGTLGLPNRYVAGLTIGAVTTGTPASNPGISLSTLTTFIFESGVSYAEFPNLVGSTSTIAVTGDADTSGTIFDVNFSALGHVNFLNVRSGRLRKLSLPFLISNPNSVSVVFGDVATGEVYTPNVTDGGIGITYGSGGLVNIDTTFSSYISGGAGITGHAGFASGTSTITPVVDFLSGWKAGSITFQAPSNWTNIALGLNATGYSGVLANFAYSTHQNTTGITVPCVPNGGRGVVVTSATTSTGDLTVTFVGPEVPSPTAARTFNISFSTTGKTLTLINNSEVVLTSAPALSSAGNLHFSGNVLTGIFLGGAGGGTGNTAFTFSGTLNVKFTTTGSAFEFRVPAGNASGLISGIFVSPSGNIDVNVLNATRINGLYIPRLGASGTTGVYDFPQATGSSTTGEAPGIPYIAFHLIPFAATATNTTQTLNIPKLHQLSGNTILSNLSGSTITVSGADLTYLSGSLTGITSGTINATFTGGPGSGSGFIAGNVVLQTPTSGTVINCNFGTLSTIGQFVRLESSGDVTFTATGLTTTSGFFATGYGTGVLNINTDFESVTGAVVLDHQGSGTINIRSSGVGTSTGVLISGIYITGRTNACTISGNLNSVQTISGNFILSSSGNVNLAATGLKEVSGVMLISGLGTGTINATTFNALTGVYASGIPFGGTATRLLSITGNTITGQVSLTGLQRVGNITGHTSYATAVISSTGIANVNLPSLTGLHSQVQIILPNATGLTLSGLTTLGASGTGGGGGDNNNLAMGFYFELGSSLTGNLNLSGLQYIYGVSARTAATLVASGLTIIGSGLTSVSMPNIITGVLTTGNITGVAVPPGTGIIRGASITGLSFGTSGTTKRLYMNFTASGCPLNQASVDDILKTFASLDGTNSTTVYSGLTITLNGLCSAPSATGSGYRTTLTGAGRLCTVLVN